METERIPEPQIEGTWVTLEAIIKNSQGIHARPCAMIVGKTLKYPGDVLMEKLAPFEQDEEQKGKINCKSLTGIMMQNLPPESKVKLYVQIYKNENAREPKIEEARTFCRELYQLVISDFEAAYKEL